MEGNELNLSPYHLVTTNWNICVRVTITVFSADGIIIIIPSALNTVMVTLTQMFQFVVTRWYGLRFNSLPSTIPIDLNQIV